MITPKKKFYLDHYDTIIEFTNFDAILMADGFFIPNYIKYVIDGFFIYIYHFFQQHKFIENPRKISNNAIIVSELTLPEVSCISPCLAIQWQKFDPLKLSLFDYSAHKHRWHRVQHLHQNFHTKTLEQPCTRCLDSTPIPSNLNIGNNFSHIRTVLLPAGKWYKRRQTSRSSFTSKKNQYLKNGQSFLQRTKYWNINSKPPSGILIQHHRFKIISRQAAWHDILHWTDPGGDRKEIGQIKRTSPRRIRNTFKQNQLIQMERRTMVERR
ncbi:hypothetical protein V1477_000670 [Vespula maculifrons]|uniref:Uncharacterized protein n=1 Tax=Vespula maculifrons TaxID=7453 RepID=A0ABD2D2A2_VESMC